jgi:hypothetical protein
VAIWYGVWGLTIIGAEWMGQLGLGAERVANPPAPVVAPVVDAPRVAPVASACGLGAAEASVGDASERKGSESVDDEKVANSPAPVVAPEVDKVGSDAVASVSGNDGDSGVIKGSGSVNDDGV